MENVTGEAGTHTVGNEQSELSGGHEFRDYCKEIIMLK